LNLEKPTDPSNYVDRSFAKGSPLNWQDDVSGQMSSAVMGYLHQKPTEDELKKVIAYIQYHIHAPCWLESSPFGVTDDEMAAEIRALRALSLTLNTVQDVNEYIERAMNIALDPL
jgi:hypothetical protein